jgi:hypothetical protein
MLSSSLALVIIDNGYGHIIDVGHFERVKVQFSCTL